MNPELAIIAISTIGTAIWTVLTWAEQEEKERRAEQDQLDALYINPFLLATQELNAVLYRILVQDELGVFRREISHECEQEGEITYHEALAIVYVIIKYFGWVFVFYHYGSYVQDQTAIKLTRNIAETFADRETFGNDAFRFTFTQQRSLGQAIVTRLSQQDPTCPEFTELSVYEFEQKLASHKPDDYFYQDIMKVVKAIREASCVRDLSGWERLLVVQNQLVDLLHYIESEEGFSVTGQQRKKTILVNDEIIEHESWFNKENAQPNFFLPPVPAPNLFDFFPKEQGREHKPRPQIVHHIYGRIRIKIPQLIDTKALRSILENINGVESVQVNQPANSVTIYYDEQITEKDFARLVLERIDRF